MPAMPHKRGRAADRAAGVGAGAAQHQPRRHRRAGAGGRSGGEMVGVPRIARRRPGQIEGRAADGEFMRRQLAQQHRAGLGPFPHYDGVLGWARCAPAGGNARSCGCRRCCRCPCGRSGCRRAGPSTRPTCMRASAALASAMARSSVTSRKLCRRGIVRSDAVEADPGQLDRRKLARRDQRGGFGDGQERVHQRISGSKMTAGSASRGSGAVARASMAWNIG